MYIVRIKVLFLTLASLLMLSSANVFANGNVWWESLSQSQRNQQIINGARLDLGKTFDSWNGQCKVWVQNMVYYLSVSQKHVWLPPNASPPFYWQIDPYEHAASLIKPIEYASPGEIVQMMLKPAYGELHTAIVESNDYYTTGKITFIESNWPNGSYSVKRRTITFAQFRDQVSYYTIYQIQ